MTWFIVAKMPLLIRAWMTPAGRRPRRFARSSTVIIGGSVSSPADTATPLPAPSTSVAVGEVVGASRRVGRPRLPPGRPRPRPPPRRNGLGLIGDSFLQRRQHGYQPTGC